MTHPLRSSLAALLLWVGACAPSTDAPTPVGLPAGGDADLPSSGRDARSPATGQRLDTSRPPDPDPSTGAPDASPPPPVTADTGVADGPASRPAADANNPVPTTPARRSAGCGKPAAGGVESRSMKVGERTRTFVLATPATYDPNVALPLFVGFHGGGSNTASGARGQFGLEKADTGLNKGIFVYPNSLRYDGSASWKGDKTNTGEYEFIDALVADLQNNLCIDLNRIFVAGISSGGYMSIHYACARSQMIRGFGAVAAGGLNPSFKCAHKVAAMFIWGTKDSADVNATAAGTRDTWLRMNSCSNQTTELVPPPCMGARACTPDASVAWCVHGGGHVWPGIAGKALWNFFATVP